MSRDILTNKWVLGGIGFLIVLSVACVLWYQHDIAPYKQEAAEAEQLLRQNLAEQTRAAQEQKTVSEITETPSDVVQEVETVELQENTFSGLPKATEEISGNVRVITVDTPQGKRVFKLPKASPHGFGPFPEIPPDYPTGAVWLQSTYYLQTTEFQRQRELLDRVLIKLWSDGEKNFKGGSISPEGKVYPNYFNTYYITIEERESLDGTIGTFFRIKGGGPPPEDVDLLNPPSHITVLDYESSGIDPFQYLNLP